jgi:hypothetical protein
MRPNASTMAGGARRDLTGHHDDRPDATQWLAPPTRLRPVETVGRRRAGGARPRRQRWSLVRGRRRGADLLAAALTTGLMVGLFYAYACSVMPALRRLDDRTFVVMQRIQREMDRYQTERSRLRLGRRCR